LWLIVYDILLELKQNIGSYQFKDGYNGGKLVTG
jgi:hypothetical protein